MTRMKFCFAPRSVGASFIVLASFLAINPDLHAQQTPDAGSLLREQSMPMPTTTPAMAAPVVPKDVVKTENNSQKIMVKNFRIEGALLIPESELSTQLQSKVGKELSFSELQEAAAILMAYYAEKGYVARAVLPPQEIKDNIVIIQIIEGRRGSLKIDNKGERINSTRVERFIEKHLPEGDKMSVVRLGEALNILNEQPGVEAKSALLPGKTDGEVDLSVTTTSKPLVNYAFGANNHGSRGTGEGQASGMVVLNNPSGLFDSVSLFTNFSDGSKFVTADYNIAVGYSGLRMGAKASYLNYDLVQDKFSALDSHGDANTMGLTAAYPLFKRNNFSLSFNGSFDQKRMVDKTTAGETSNRLVDVTKLGFSGYRNTKIGTTSFGTNVGFGESDQRNNDSLNTDRTTRKIQGQFTKLEYNAAHLVAINTNWRITASLRGQIADKNLDSAERFSLGGPNGVKAYPVGEASGDEGWLAGLNLTRSFGENIAANLFFDNGRIRLNRDTWQAWNANNPSLRNSYQLSDVGVGIDWRYGKAFMSASVATALGSNPGRDSDNLDADGRKRDTRGWLSVNVQF